MTTNREWLYGLDVADLAAWFDAEHAEPNGDLSPENGVSDPDGGSNVAYVAQDSREKLEADVEEICWGKNDNRYFAQKCYLSSYSIEVDEGNVMANHEGHVLMTVIMHLLDRQAAITERECESAAWKANYRHVKDRADKLQHQVDELTAEIVSLMQKKQPYTFNPEAPIENIKTICRYIDELTAERDELREKLSQAIGHASDILRFQDLTAVDVEGEMRS